MKMKNKYFVWFGTLYKYVSHNTVLDRQVVTCKCFNDSYELGFTMICISGTIPFSKGKDAIEAEKVWRRKCEHALVMLFKRKANIQEQESEINKELL